MIEMPTYQSSGNSLANHNRKARECVEEALAQLRNLLPQSDDAVAHIANAERELRAAVRAMRDIE